MGCTVTDSEIKINKQLTNQLNLCFGLDTELAKPVKHPTEMGMPLEEALMKNNELLTEHNDLLRKLLGKAGDAGAKKSAADNDEGGDTEEKPKTTRTRAKKADADDAGEAKKAAAGPKTSDASDLVSEWLGEVEYEVDDEGKPVNDDEDTLKLVKKRKARVTFIKKCLGKLGVEKVGELTEAADIKKFLAWIEAKKGGTDPFEDDEV